MAARTYLSDEEWNKAREDFFNSQAGSSLVFASWLSERLYQKLSALEGWRKSQPIALGSWARGHLCPRSDIDLLLVGENESVRQWMKQAQEAGFKVRARQPKDLQDWTIGVQTSDEISLLDAHAFFPETEYELNEQKAKILKRPRTWKKARLNTIKMERQTRHKRFNALSRLEPNLKYSAGGLRDLLQSKLMLSLFEEVDLQKEVERINQLFLTVLLWRQGLQLIGGSEVISGQEQYQLAQEFGEGANEFSRKIQQNLEEANVLCQLSVEWLNYGKSQRKYFGNLQIESLASIQTLLKSRTSITIQTKIRDYLQLNQDLISPKKRMALLKESLDPKQDKKAFKAKLTSGWFDYLEPEFKRIRGLVQFDHYHIYPLDEHIFQCLCILSDLRNNLKNFGHLKWLVDSFDEEDWVTLSLVCLYHDLGKGLGGDHSEKGARIVADRLRESGLNKRQKEDVAWLVRHHLLLSTAAFRMDPMKAATWKFLLDAGAFGRRLRLLAVWTIIDIRATNPAAWTSWKARLLHDLVSAVESPRHGFYFQSLMGKVKNGEKDLGCLIESLDLSFLNRLSPNVLVSDLRRLLNSQESHPILIKRLSVQRYWIRFHQRIDHKGLFLDFVRRINATGATILQASVQTIDSIGAYDWFLIKTQKTPAQLKKILGELQFNDPIGSSEIKFQQIELIGESEAEWIISFRGLDQKGFLLRAATLLYEKKLSINWAKVNTWGRQVDDVFGVIKTSNWSREELVQQLTSPTQIAST